jgi:hypothetical protein
LSLPNILASALPNTLVSSSFTSPASTGFQNEPEKFFHQQNQLLDLICLSPMTQCSPQLQLLKTNTSIFLLLRNQMEVCEKSLEKLVTNVKLAFSNVFIDKDSCNKIEVNNDVIIPINNVVAKPFIGPEPNMNNTAPIKM